MPNAELVSMERIAKRVQSRLGGRTIKIELEQDDYVEFVKQALDYYNQRRPFKRKNKLASVTISQRRYVIPLNLHPGFAGIIHVDFITRRSSPSRVDPFDPFDTALAGVSLGSGSGETFGELLQRIMYTEDSARVIDAEPDWDGIWEGADYALYVDIARPHVEVGYEWSGYYSPDFVAPTGLQFIPNGDVDWFLKYVTACAKETLGRVRGKFQGITNPDGSQDPVDYTELLQEAQQEKERLEDELTKRRPPLGPITE